MEENYKGLDKDEFINKGYELIDEIFEIFEEYIQRGEDEESIGITAGVHSGNRISERLQQRRQE